jgi:pyruvate/2-oxoglutarate dehydrogenase complex dihydrolipoamide acyltransferase (E2) component
MAQDSGVIVAWLKNPGDAVKAGDALMEVETDKATMEVEAAHDGFLADVRAGAGESVPVGEIVAVISESADGAAPAPAAKEHAPADAPAQGGAEALPEGREVIMPALGMAQDSGIVVAWHKEPGAAVAEGDALLEVETDKATMEVEAHHAGYLAAILAEAGDDVPVGQVIAVISSEAPDAPVRRTMAAAPAGRARDPAPRPEPEPAPKPGAASAQKGAGGAGAAPSPAAAAKPAGRILASPKARRLAAEEGLDLADLVAAGHAPPFHAADLETLRALPQAAPAQPAQAGEVGVVSAEVDAAAFDAFRGWLADEGTAPSSPRLLAAFAAGALRAASEDAGPLTVAAGALGAQSAWDDPDRAPLATDLPESGAAPALLLRDLTGTALTGIKPAAAPVPVVTITRRGDTLALHLAHDATLPEEAALALLSGFADRLQEPLRHLL